MNKSDQTSPLASRVFDWILKTFYLLALGGLLVGCSQSQPDVTANTPDESQLLEAADIHNTSSVLNRQAMFKVEAIAYTAIDETGWDFLGSDEVYAVWLSNATLATQITDDVDSGDRIEFHPLQTCIYPVAGDRVFVDGRHGGEDSGWRCKESGGPGPIEFTALFYDDDSPWTNIPFCFSGDLASDCEDTFIGKYVGRWSTQELVSGWPTPGTSREFTVRLNPCPGPAVCGDDDFPDYDFHFRITRMEDKEITLVIQGE